MEQSYDFTGIESALADFESTGSRLALRVSLGAYMAFIYDIASDDVDLSQLHINGQSGWGMRYSDAHRLRRFVEKVKRSDESAISARVRHLISNHSKPCVDDEPVRLVKPY